MRILLSTPFLSVGLILAMSGCGSDDGDDSVTARGTGGLIDLDDRDGGAADGSGGNGNLDGGFIEKSDQEVDELENAACTGWSAEPESIPALLMMVIDTSASMDSNAPDSQASKWSITAQALNEAIAAIPESTPLGLMFYPNEGLYRATTPAEITQCVDVSSLVPVAPNQQEALYSAIGQVDPNGCTPTHGAFMYALEHGLRATSYPGDKYILLITDGQPTLTIDCMGSCNPRDPVDEEPIIEAIEAAFTADRTRTFVIGSPGSEENETTGEDVRAWLSHAAVAGGTAPEVCQVNGPEDFCHFDLSVVEDFGQGLRDALARITGAIVQCSYDIPPPPPGETVDPRAVNLIVSPSDGTNLLMLPAADGSCTEGWYYDGNRVTLCPDTCARVQSDSGASLKLLFGCATGTDDPIT